MNYLYFSLTKWSIGIPLIGQCQFVPMPEKRTGIVRFSGKRVPIVDLHDLFEGRSRADTFEGNLLIISAPEPIALLIDSESTPSQPEHGLTKYLRSAWLAKFARDNYIVYSPFRRH